MIALIFPRFCYLGEIWRVGMQVIVPIIKLVLCKLLRPLITAIFKRMFLNFYLTNIGKGKQALGSTR